MDPLSDMLIHIKNAGEAGKHTVVVSHSNFKFKVAEVLLREGYIAGLARKGRGIKKLIEITLAYNGKRPRIQGIKKLSKPSRRIYQGIRGIRLVRQGFGNVILSTPKGIVTGREARKAKVGGEVLFTIW